MLSRLSYLYRAWRYRFRVDPAEIHYLLSTLRPGDTAVDIGCHKGGYLYWMRRRVGLHGRVYAFEPQPRLFEYLTVIQKQLNFNNVQLENMGLSSQTGSMTLHIPASSSGTSPGATLNAVTESNPTDFHHHTVQVSTLDAYFHAQGIRPALLKIDVEGHEWELLKGGQALLEACRPRILMECENRHLGGGDVQDVFRFLLDLGYAGRFIHKGKLRPLAEFDDAAIDALILTDLAASASLSRDAAAIDLPAGPSEVLVIADDSAEPAFVAADLLAQAEHSPDAQVMLVALSRKFADACAAEVARQLDSLPRREIAAAAIGSSRILLVPDLETALEVSNRYAPEHLILQVRAPRRWLDRVRNAGSVFLGAWTPETLGDYCSGTNHVLPTYGHARAYSGLGVLDFVRRMTVQEATPEGLADLGPVARTLAKLESLDAHARAVEVRLEALESEARK